MSAGSPEEVATQGHPGPANSSQAPRHHPKWIARHYSALLLAFDHLSLVAAHALLTRAGLLVVACGGHLWSFATMGQQQRGRP